MIRPNFAKLLHKFSATKFLSLIISLHKPKENFQTVDFATVDFALFNCIPHIVGVRISPKSWEFHKTIPDLTQVSLQIFQRWS